MLGERITVPTPKGSVHQEIWMNITKEVVKRKTNTNRLYLEYGDEYELLFSVKPVHGQNKYLDWLKEHKDIYRLKEFLVGNAKIEPS